MLKRIMRKLCILAAAAPLATAAIGADLKPTQIAGRWTGVTHDQKAGSLTLDIVACGKGWCGIKVEAGERCGGTALKVAFVELLGAPSHSLQFDGTFELAEGTEPYVVQAWLVPSSEKHPLHLQIAGDTGGAYREYRRSFEFDAVLSRVADAICRAPQTVSSLR
jgi:hypothetical protein